MELVELPKGTAVETARISGKCTGLAPAIIIEVEEEMKVKDHKNDETDFYIHYLVDEDIDYGTLIDEL
jgi:hypothetical protein